MQRVLCMTACKWETELDGPGRIAVETIASVSKVQNIWCAIAYMICVLEATRVAQ